VQKDPNDKRLKNAINKKKKKRSSYDLKLSRKKREGLELVKGVGCNHQLLYEG